MRESCRNSPKNHGILHLLHLKIQYLVKNQLVYKRYELFYFLVNVIERFIKVTIQKSITTSSLVLRNIRYVLRNNFILE